MTRGLQGHVVDPIVASAQAPGFIVWRARREAYTDAFWIIAVGLIVGIAAIPLLKKRQEAAGLSRLTEVASA